MDHEVGPWKMTFSMVKLPQSNFFYLKENKKTKQYTKPLSPSLGVNQNVDQEEWPCTKK
jgi:hypothetical protein